MKKDSRFNGLAAGLVSNDLRRTPLYYAEWTDCATSQGWRKTDNLCGTALCITVGFLVENNPGHISLAASVSENGHVAEVTHIPKPNIERLCRLGVPGVPSGTNRPGYTVAGIRYEDRAPKGGKAPSRSGGR